MLALLSLPLFAISASANSVSNASSCFRDSLLVSCQTRVKVDPTSFGTCCYNGALESGFKESGLVLSTQFWDTDPSTGPADSTTIHGETFIQIMILVFFGEGGGFPPFLNHCAHTWLAIVFLTGLWPDYCDGTYPQVRCQD